MLALEIEELKQKLKTEEILATATTNERPMALKRMVRADFLSKDALQDRISIQKLRNNRKMDVQPKQPAQTTSDHVATTLESDHELEDMLRQPQDTTTTLALPTFTEIELCTDVTMEQMQLAEEKVILLTNSMIEKDDMVNELKGRIALLENEKIQLQAANSKENDQQVGEYIDDDVFDTTPRHAKQSKVLLVHQEIQTDPVKVQQENPFEKKSTLKMEKEVQTDEVLPTIIVEPPPSVPPHNEEQQKPEEETRDNASEQTGTPTPDPIQHEPSPSPTREPTPYVEDTVPQTNNKSVIDEKPAIPTNDRKYIDELSKRDDERIPQFPPPTELPSPAISPIPEEQARFVVLVICNIFKAKNQQVNQAP